MSYLLTCGIISLLFGLLLLASPAALGGLGGVVNSVLFTLDGWLMRFRTGIGVVLLALGGWILYVALGYPAPYLTCAWIVTIAFGLLFLFFPGWLTWLSRLSNAILLSTDDLVMGSRRVTGIVLLIISFYIFYASLLVK